MIKSFKHKGLRDFFKSGSLKGITTTHKDLLRVRLNAMDTATVIEDLNMPGYDLHPLKGKMKGRHSITVNKNWRITFEFIDGNVYVIDYEDYH